MVPTKQQPEKCPTCGHSLEDTTAGLGETLVAELLRRIEETKAGTVEIYWTETAP